MCASYGALESTLVSSRSTVPDTLVRAAARTFAATSRVSGCSVLPLTVWRPCGADDEDVDDGWAAFVGAFAATAPPPRAGPPAAEGGRPRGGGHEVGSDAGHGHLLLGSRCPPSPRSLRSTRGNPESRPQCL